MVIVLSSFISCVCRRKEGKNQSALGLIIGGKTDLSFCQARWFAAANRVHAMPGVWANKGSSPARLAIWIHAVSQSLGRLAATTTGAKANFYETDVTVLNKGDPISSGFMAPTIRRMSAQTTGTLGGVIFPAFVRPSRSFFQRNRIGAQT